MFTPYVNCKKEFEDFNCKDCNHKKVESYSEDTYEINENHECCRYCNYCELFYSCSDPFKIFTCYEKTSPFPNGFCSSQCSYEFMCTIFNRVLNKDIKNG